MKLKAKLLDIQAGGRRIAIMDDETAALLGVYSSDRVRISYKNKQIIAITNIASNFPRNQIGFYSEISRMLGIKTGEKVEVQHAHIPESLSYVQEKNQRRKTPRKQNKSHSQGRSRASLERC